VGERQGRGGRTPRMGWVHHRVGPGGTARPWTTARVITGCRPMAPNRPKFSRPDRPTAHYGDIRRSATPPHSHTGWDFCRLHKGPGFGPAARAITKPCTSRTAGLSKPLGPERGARNVDSPEQSFWRSGEGVGTVEMSHSPRKLWWRVRRVVGGGMVGEKRDGVSAKRAPFRLQLRDRRLTGTCQC
jgi:hypothetical protein